MKAAKSTKCILATILFVIKLFYYRNDLAKHNESKCLVRFCPLIRLSNLPKIIFKIQLLESIKFKFIVSVPTGADHYKDAVVVCFIIIILITVSIRSINDSHNFNPQQHHFCTFPQRRKASRLRFMNGL